MLPLLRVSHTNMYCTNIFSFILQRCSWVPASKYLYNFTHLDDGRNQLSRSSGTKPNWEFTGGNPKFLTSVLSRINNPRHDSSHKLVFNTVIVETWSTSKFAYPGGLLSWKIMKIAGLELSTNLFPWKCGQGEMEDSDSFLPMTLDFEEKCQWCSAV